LNNGGHPLVDSLRRVGELGAEYDLPTRDPGQEGWIKAQSLFQDDDQRLRNFVSAYGRDFVDTDNRHLAASAFTIAYLTRLTYPLISQYVLERRVIDISLSNLEFHTDGQRFNGTALASPRFAALPDDPAAGHPDAEIVPDDAALYARLKKQLFDYNFDIVIPSLRRAAQASIKVSWNAVAASCAQVFYWLYELTEDTESIVRHAEAFFGDPSSPVYDEVRMELVAHQGKNGYFARRAGCCLFWRIRDEDVYCSGCILLSDEEQTIRFKQLLENMS
jgi:ferric iron reductase protein FhuF